MKKILFFAALAIAIASRGAAFGADDPEKVKTLSAWVTYSVDEQEDNLTTNSHTLLLQPGGVAYLAVNRNGRVVARVQGAWRIEGKRIVFDGLILEDIVTGKRITYKNAVVKSANGDPYMVVKTSAGQRYFITL